MKARIERLKAFPLRLGTEEPHESDGTLTWDATTMIVVELAAGGMWGLGYTYAHESAARLIEDLLGPCVLGTHALNLPEAHARMARGVRNQGRQGVAAMAISAVDVALWDLKARLLELPLAHLLGARRPQVPAYASGGFTSTGLDALARELCDYVNEGYRRVKIKVGREPARDRERVRVARSALPPEVELMVDANGAYDRKQALAMAESFCNLGVSWFEEPVSSEDLAGLRFLRERAPAGMHIAAGEYGYEAGYYRRMLSANAVDVLQADATRCMGITGFARVDSLCSAFEVPLSCHCAPALHCQPAASADKLMHVECFRDHVRMEGRLFEGTPALRDGQLWFDPSRPGLGLRLRSDEVGRYAIS